MKAKKQKAVRKLIEDEENAQIPTYSPLKRKYPDLSTSFVRRRSGMVRKLLTTKPTTAIQILKHVWDQLYKMPSMRVLMNKYWGKETNLACLMLDIGKQRGRKDDVKLLQSVNKVKQKYNSLRQACRLADISWTKFHRHTYIKAHGRKSKDYIRKLSEVDIESIQQHYQSDEVSFLLPDKKYHGKRFLKIQLEQMYKDVQFMS